MAGSGSVSAPDAPEAPDLGDRRLRAFMGYSLKRAYHCFQSDAMRVLDGFGLRLSTYSALSVICDNADLRQSQLAQILGIERSNTVVVIDALENAGLIERHKVPKDRRSYALRATAAGRELWERATRALDVHEDRIMAGITDEERAVLTRLLRRMETAAESPEHPEGGNRNA